MHAKPDPRFPALAHGRRLLSTTLEWLGHAMALCFWLGVAAMLVLRMFFGPMTPSDLDTVSDSPSARYRLAVTHFDPGAMGTALQSFRLRQGLDGRQVALLELKASPAVAAIVPDWRDDTVTLSGIPASSLRRITRGGDPAASPVLRFVDESREQP
ncbi:hypothetical protein ACNI65_02740 [Roseateles sp. So40a]|uniref:hypothetical protein n=1 Tax=Roseateles sp. So40a TaxID=3400226 RepID=UPI003A8C4A5E